MRPIFILIFMLNIAVSQDQDSIVVTYIANDGFLLSCHENKVLIDALFNQSFGRYTPASDETKSNIINGRAPFEFIDLYLVTHNHGDHFSAPEVTTFLLKHKETSLIGSDEVGNQCQKEERIKDRIHNFVLDIGASVDTSINGIQLKIFRLKHLGDTTGLRIANLAYIIRLGKFNILHMGDITIENSISYLDALNFQNQKIDILFLPYFDISETSSKYVGEIIKPRYLIAKHLPPADYETESKKFLKVYQSGIVFEKQLEEKVLK